MNNLTPILGLLKCVGCGSHALEVPADGGSVVCNGCGATFRIVNNVPCFVPDELIDFSEVAPEKRGRFIAAKEMAYSGTSLVNRMYNHYHEYAAARRRMVGTCPRTLDIGFGVGEHYPHLAEEERKGFSFIGVDLDRFKLEFFASGHPAFPVLQADVFRLPFADNSMEVVQILATLEHFSPDDISLILDEALRTLQRGGVLIVCYPAEGGALLRVCQVLMHTAIRLKTGFDLEHEHIHRHLSSAVDIRNILGNRPDLERSETRYYPLNLPLMSCALFVNEQYRKAAT